MIHYHGVAGLDALCLRALQGRHLLWSFAHGRPLWERMRQIAGTYCVDSGAFSAWKSGAVLDWDEYADVASEAAADPSCDFIIGPDVIGAGWGENAAHQGDWFHRSGIPHAKRCPVWHTDPGEESLAQLRYYAKTYARVAIGSTAAFPLRSPAWWDCMHRAWESLAPRGSVVPSVHGLRMLHPEIIRAFPWASCDSTTASRNARKGQARRFWDGCSKAIKVVAYAQELESVMPPLRYSQPAALPSVQELLWQA